MELNKYQNCLIYKISCLDENVKEIYIGHTTIKLKIRQRVHRSYCKYNTSKLYSYIRANGGFENFKFEIIEHYPCNSLYEAKEREKNLIFLMKSSLNSNVPNQTHQEYRERHKEEYNEYMKKYMAKYNHKKRIMSLLKYIVDRVFK